MLRRAALACVILLCTAPHAAGAAPLSRAHLKLTFEDEFTTFNWDAAYNGAGKTAGVWRTSYNHGPDKNALDNRSLPGNRELQVYLDQAYPEAGRNSLGINPFEIIDRDVLRISANPAPEEIRGQIYDRLYTSGMIASWGSFAQRYGVFEMRARMPEGQGLWPAFWLLKQQGGWPPEIDIVEILGHQPDQAWVAVHTAATGTHAAAGGPTIVANTSSAFHTYAVDWGPSYCVFYFDGREIWRHVTPPDANKPMFMIINLAVGGKWPGKPDETTEFPAHLDIDYVRVWQRPEYVNARDPKPWPKPKKTLAKAPVLKTLKPLPRVPTTSAKPK
jgi:beta-glucanase (GH16 family)